MNILFITHTRIGDAVSGTASTVANRRSERVMQRLGMVHSGEFDHPNVPRGHRVCRHVLYRSTRAQWRERG